MTVTPDDQIDAYEQGKRGSSIEFALTRQVRRQVARDPAGPFTLTNIDTAEISRAWQKGNDMFVKQALRGGRR